jgi:nucleotide-binding universal stress UspA family protein
MKAKKAFESTSAIPNCQIERILYTTDLTPGYDEALDCAIMLATTFNAKLFLCHCLDTVLTLMEDAAEKLAHITDVMERSIGDYISPTEPPKLDWHTVIAQGNAAEAIARQAAEKSVDLIVMRSRRRPRAAALLGSTAEAVCRIAPCPVLVTHPYEREWVDAENKVNIKRMLVAFDFSDNAKLALSNALMLAKHYESELHVLEVCPPGNEVVGSPIFGNPFHDSASRLDAILPENAREQFQIKSLVVSGEAYNEILKYAKENDIDLICMGAHGQSYDRYDLFGSNMDMVLRKATCPIFIARPKMIIEIDNA